MTGVQEVDKVTVYNTFSEKTKQITELGTYQLDPNSLYTNGNYAYGWIILRCVLVDFCSSDFIMKS